MSDNKTLVKPNAIDEEYTVRIDSLSTEFDSKVYSHTAGAELKFNEKNTMLPLVQKFAIRCFIKMT
ncbi:MAG: hypothetical protein IPL09_02895 [Bacteroidetes bacterium]|nr:hypothetical protein [Bacteroidota bacterium]